MAEEPKTRAELQAAYDDAVKRRDTRAQHRFGKELRAMTHASLTEEIQAERKAQMTKINIADIRVNGGTQSRASINREVVSDYADAIEHGAEFPPVVVFYDGSTYWLADGFHRYEAYASANVNEVPADIRQGTQRDAILFSVGANAHHGLRRTKEDRERAVLTLLNDPEWAQWPQTKIAKACGVSQSVVSRVVTKHNPASYAENKMRTVERGGTTYEQNTANIGKAKPAEQTPEPLVQAAHTGEAAPGSGGAAEQANAPAPKPELATDPYAKERKGLDKFTREGLEDELIEARIALKDEKAKRKKAESEARRLREVNAELAADDKNAASVKYEAKLTSVRHQRKTANDNLEAEKRKNYALNKDIQKLNKTIEELRQQLEGQEIAL